MPERQITTTIMFVRTTKNREKKNYYENEIK